MKRFATHTAEAWSAAYKRSVDCHHPKGFSQRAHCAGKRKRLEEAIATKPESVLYSFADTVTRQDSRAEFVGVLHLVDEPPVDLTPQHARKGQTSGYHTLHAFGVDPQNRAFVYIFTNTYRWEIGRAHV